VALILTRQALPTLDRAKYANAIGLARGAYTLAEAPNGNPEVLLLATGSEVVLVRRGLRATCPRWNQSSRRQHAVLAAYSKNKIRSTGDSVLPPTVKARVSVEEGSTFGWDPVELSGALRQSTRADAARSLSSRRYVARPPGRIYRSLGEGRRVECGYRLPRPHRTKLIAWVNLITRDCGSLPARVAALALRSAPGHRAIGAAVALQSPGVKQ
jgi:hypothetical protein